MESPSLAIGRAGAKRNARFEPSRARAPRPRSRSGLLQPQKRLVGKPSNFECILKGNQEGPRMFGGPFLARVGIHKEVDVVAEAGDDVCVKRAARLEEGNDDPGRLDGLYAVGPYAQRDLPTGRRTARLDGERRVEAAGKKERVPCAPRPQIASVQSEFVRRHLDHRQAPEPHDTAPVVAMEARPASKPRLDF